MKKYLRVSNLLVITGLALAIFGVGSSFFDIRTGLAGGLASPAPDAGLPGAENESAYPAPTVAPTLVPQTQSSEPADLSSDTFLSQELPSPTPPSTDSRVYIPLRIVIPAIGLDAPIVEAQYKQLKWGAQTFQQWEAPDKFAAGWLPTSATLGLPGNTVLDGHHNVYGEVFRHLVDLKAGDLIQVYSTERVFYYQVTNRMILKERDEPLSVRLANAQWIEPSNDERLTLITCWPYYSNTHRLIIVARPIGSASLSKEDTQDR